MSIFTDIFNKILGKIKGLVPGANSVSDLGVNPSFKSGSAEKNEALRKSLFKKIAANGGNIPASLLD